MPKKTGPSACSTELTMHYIADIDLFEQDE